MTRPLLPAALAFLLSACASDAPFPVEEDSGLLEDTAGSQAQDDGEGTAFSCEHSAYAGVWAAPFGDSGSVMTFSTEPQGALDEVMGDVTFSGSRTISAGSTGGCSLDVLCSVPGADGSDAVTLRWREGDPRCSEGALRLSLLDPDTLQVDFSRTLDGEILVTTVLARAE